MNHALQQLAFAHALASEDNRKLRLRFGLACANRVRHLLEDSRAVGLLDVLQNSVADDRDDAALHAAASEAALVASGHRGSASIDGSKHSAVSATYAVANALAGRALHAAEYAAYSTVYGYGSYAVSDPDSFAPEYAWQVMTLQQLLDAKDAAAAH
jgi:hypothetical protein